MNTSIRRLFAVLACGFLLLGLLLGYWQVVAAGDLADRTDNRQAQRRDQTVDRGRIITADRIVVARSVPRVIRGQTTYVRGYPQGTLAPHVVGYASPQVGSTGLEAQYNSYLRGSYGAEPLLVRLRLRTAHGADIHLTIDQRVQEVADQQLLGRKGAVVAIDPKTGAILAMASSPGYDLAKVSDPKAFAQIRTAPDSPLYNRATQGRYPPGSTFKLVTLVAALESDLGYSSQTRFDDTGTLRTNGPPIRNFGGHVYGDHDLTQALTNSVNTTFARIGLNLGANRMGEQMEAFGFGRKPGIDLPGNEVLASGRYQGGKLLPNIAGDADLARIAIGQEKLSVTPLEMAMVAATIANGCTQMRPYLVTNAVDRSGSDVFEQSPSQVRQVCSADTARIVTDMMGNVVREGTGTQAALQGLDVAGKTGTAETGDGGLNDAWFVGFAPKDDPKVAIAVVVEGTPDTGGVAAAPIAREVMKKAIERSGG